MTYGKWISFTLMLLAVSSGCQTTGSKGTSLDPTEAASSDPTRLDGMAGGDANGRKTALDGLYRSKKSSVPSLGQKSSFAPLPQDASHVARASHSIQRTAHSMREALTPEVKTIQASDATNLAHNPGPLQPGLYLAAARMMEQQGNWAGAQEKYQALLQLEPNNLQSMIGLARIYHRQGAMDDAIAAYQSAIAVHGPDPVLLNDLALCYGRSGKTVEAISALRQAMVSVPDSLLYRNNLAALLVEANRDQEAVEVLEEMHGPAIAHYNVGYLLYRRNMVDKARSHFITSLQSDPNLRAAQVMLKKLENSEQVNVTVPSGVDRTTGQYAQPTAGHSEGANPAAWSAAAVAMNQSPTNSPTGPDWSPPLPIVDAAVVVSVDLPSAAPARTMPLVPRAEVRLVSHAAAEFGSSGDANPVPTAESSAAPSIRQPELHRRKKARVGFIAPSP